MAKVALRVAIVDDDSSVRKALARLLTTVGFETETFASAHDFLGALENHTFNCLIADLHMPETSGLDLQQHLRRNDLKIPAIIITAYNEPDIREQCEASGAAFLLKPVSEGVLIRAVRTAVAGQQPNGTPNIH